MTMPIKGFLPIYHLDKHCPSYLLGILISGAKHWKLSQQGIPFTRVKGVMHGKIKSIRRVLMEKTLSFPNSSVEFLHVINYLKYFK